MYNGEGDEYYYLQVAANFWEIVVNNHINITGVNMTIPLLDAFINDVIVIKEDTIKNWLANINENLVRHR